MNMSSLIMVKCLFLISIFCMAGVYATTSHAATICSFLTGTPNDGEIVNFGSVLMQRDVAVGTAVATTTKTTFSSRPGFYRCSNPDGVETQGLRWSVEGVTPITYNGEQLFSVGLAGLAMRVQTPGLPGGATFPRDRLNDVSCLSNGLFRDYCGASWGITTFQLVKVGATGNGTTSIPGRIRASVINKSFVYSYSFGASAVTTVACSVSNTAVAVPLGNVNLSNFTGIGSTPVARNFNVALNCNAGTRVNITLSGTAHSSGIAGMLALSPASGTVAQGVGVQLLRNNVPVALGTPIATGTAAAAGAYNIPLVARYYQTAATVLPGLANSAATFTMSYN